jgi:hypothetical protein
MPTEATRAVPDRTPWQQRAVLAGTARHHGFNAPLTHAQADELALLLKGGQR